MVNKVKIKPEIYLSKLSSAELDNIVNELDKPDKNIRMAVETIYGKVDVLYLQAQSLYYPLIKELHNRLKGGVWA